VTREYVTEVAQSLKDLRWNQRRDLVADLRQNLAELPAGTDAVARLGAPEEYAAELRAAAGLAPERGPLGFVRRFRPRSLALIGALAVAAALLTAVLLIRYERQQFVQNYQPLRHGNLARYPDHARGLGGLDGQSVDVHVGRPFQFGLEIVNAGRYLVRVLGLSYPRIEPWHAQLSMGPPSTIEGTQTPLRAFHPFDLGPGQYVWLSLKGVYWCTTGWSKGVGTSIDEFPVRYRFHSHWAIARIPLPEPLGFTMTENCPSGGVPWTKR